MLSPAALLLLVTLAATVPGNETALGPPAIVNRTLSRDSTIAAAGSPYGFLVVWYDRDQQSLRAARLRTDGSLIDTNPIVLVSADERYAKPRVAWNGTHYVVSGLGTYLVSPEGVVSAPRESLQADYTFPSGSTFFVVASDGTRHDLARVPDIGPLRVELAMKPDADWRAIVTYIGIPYWYRIKPGGAIERTRLAATGSDTWFVDAAASGDEIAVSFVTQNPGYEFGYMIVDAKSGETKRIERLAFSERPRVWSQAALAYDGGELLAAWAEAEGEKTLLRVMSASGTRTVATYGPSDAIVGPALASGARNLLVWDAADGTRCCAETFARVFDGAEELELAQEPQPLTRGPAAQVETRAAAGPRGVLAVWQEPSPRPRLLGTFGAGTFAISSARAYTAHAVAANTDTYAVVWSEPDYTFTDCCGVSPTGLRMLVRRYDASGNAIDAAPQLIARDAAPLPEARAQKPRVAAIADGASFVVAWFGQDRNLYAARVPSRGSIATTPVRISTKNKPLTGVVLVRAGGRIVAVHDQDDYKMREYYAVALRDDLTPLSESALWVVRRFGTGNMFPGFEIDRNPFDAASNGEELLLTWSERGLPQTDAYCVHAQRFSASLVPVEPPRVVTCNQTQFAGDNDRTLVPAAAWDGGAWWIAATGFLKDEPLNAWRLAAGGNSEPPVTFAPRDLAPFDATLLLTPNGLAAVYSRNAPATFLGIRMSDTTPRAFLRLLSATPPPPTRGRAVRH